uniref:PsbP C-terminal domain-containing protein n=1 Tax=Vitis vinifera TaxID=29760 RepID=A5BMR5_VITVI|nr:hypothetical protein VITISV_011517 [Vitis vinifera]
MEAIRVLFEQEGPQSLNCFIAFGGCFTKHRFQSSGSRAGRVSEVDKGGATVLFEEENKGVNNVGVVVSPVRLESLKQFGSPQFVADKVIQAEKRKESTKDVELIGVAERSSQGGLQVYEFEYIIDSTRGGMKRIFSAAFVNSKKLYLLNIAHMDKPESPLDSHTRTMLEQVLHSFDAAPLT